MTLYLKYRPQKILELDLGSVREMLAGIVAGLGRGGMPHAFLFSGPRGTGKTSAARILAKALNCEKLTAGEPCGDCDMCEGIAAGTAYDVVEVDAASNRGIEEVRVLREGVKLAPMRAKFKVYIIDEAHMLTTEAANALLKTLEEPPEHAVFILCTTEPDKLPVTVVSRCARVNFGQPTMEEVAEKLKRVAGEEGAGMSEADIMSIAKAAKGSFRDGIKILEQVILAGGDVRGVLGVVEAVEPEDFVAAVERGDAAGALEMINKLVGGGGSVRGFIERCVERLRERMLGRDSWEKSRADLALIEGLERAYERTRTTAVVQLPLEVFVVENAAWGQSAGGDRDEKEEVVEEKKPEQKLEEPQRHRLEDVVGRWPEVMRQVRPKNHSVEALLRSTRPVGFDGERLELEVFYKFHKEKLESEKCRRIVEGAVMDVFGVSGVKLSLRLGEKKRRGLEPDGDTENINGAVDEDIVRAAEEIFKAEAI